ncbi:MAG: decarboxylating 6-phosphogluconate dehydrogenase [Thermodesulfobacteriota bacterium]|nr:MAG: decarboxylating 6-phosphogluconate dehydrogenase [Thermodesulfobacteriota bacterium]
MQLGFIGLGKMGLNMVTRLLRSEGHDVVVFNKTKAPVESAVKIGAIRARSLRELTAKLEKPRTIWLMIPSGPPVDGVIGKLLPLLSKDDTIIDGGNSNYKDSMRRAKELSKMGINFLDAGTSGGVWGLTEGYCLMVGGKKKVFKRVKSIFETLAPEGGFSYTGPSGAGHYVKMVHNGIEYGMLQAYAEGFSLLEASDFDLDLEDLSRLWNHGSVIRSWLLELCENVFDKDPDLEKIKAYVEDSGEGRWTILDSLEKDRPCPVITLSLLSRLRSREDNPFAARVIAALRHEFGGHGVKK